MDEARITVFADPDGYVEIHVRPERESQQIHRLIVSAEDDPLEQVVEILPSATASEYFREIPEPQRKRGVPPRQSPEEAAQSGNQFDSWLKRQMTDGMRVKPEVKAHPYFRRLKPYVVQPTPDTSPNWSGFELYGPSRSYDYVGGSWVVPAAIAGEPDTRTSILSWVGIDGFNTADLVQAGTGAESAAAGGVTISTYYAWTEFLPQQPTMRIVTSISIRPGDAVTCIIVLSEDGYLWPAPNIDGNNAAFSLSNATTGKGTVVYVDRDTTVVGGSEAEWIMERASYNGVYSDLADYGSADMSNCLAHRVGEPIDQHTYYQDDANRQISMVNGNTTLSTVTPVSSDQMRFSWHAFH
jgi:hypothetical protein